MAVREKIIGKAGSFSGNKQISEHSYLAIGEVLEGWIDPKYYLGYAPQVVWVAVGVYETQDHGVLVEVLVKDNGNGNIEPEEFIDP